MRRWAIGIVMGVLLLGLAQADLRAQGAPGLQGAVSGIVGGSFSEYEERLPLSPHGALQATLSYTWKRLAVGVVGELGLTGISWGLSCGGGPCPDDHALQWDRHRAGGAVVGVWLGRVQLYGTVERARIRYGGGDAGSVNIFGLGLRLPEAAALVPDMMELRHHEYGRWEIDSTDVIEVRLAYDLLRSGAR